ncbi:MAG TPA: NAD-dependent protein deacetylase [Vicinamibacteria bacterium]|nr:NAD-dependent protein deacetylase [Vicinamibacteria bacterium]
MRDEPARGADAGITEAGLEALARFLDRCSRLLVLTGAGCSTGSGIPAYRDGEGGWRHRRPMGFAEFVSSEAARRRYWAGSLRGWPRVRDARPNGAHHALARLEGRGRLARIVTQNVDGLHQKAGSRRVLDLHGRLDTVECLGCGARTGREDVQALLLAWNPAFASSPAAAALPDGDSTAEAQLGGFRVPDCRECGGVLKPWVVFFGENVPPSRVEQALSDLERADGLLVIGSSLMAHSGYRFVLAARARGLVVAAINLGRTRADEAIQVKVARECGETLSRLVEPLGPSGTGRTPPLVPAAP